MKKLLFVIIPFCVLLAACVPATPVTPTAVPPTDTIPAPTDTPLPTATLTPSPTETPLYPVEGYGPSNFPADIDPLTGIKVADPTLLERRPLLIKVSNLPRNNRPQWGLSLADIVFEYYTEEGTTRFAAIFLGNNADMVGPIRSGRFIDANLVRGYKAMFAFGSAYVSEMDRFLNSEFVDRLVIEGPNTPLTRFEPNGYNFLIANTSTLSAYATARGIQNGRQNLDGMSFKLEPAGGGQPGMQVIVRYSGAIFNRWDYDPTSGKYLRFSDTTEAMDAANEKYAQATDRLTSQPIAYDNVVVLFVTHEQYSPGIYDILLNGSGDAFAFRDGQIFQVKWQRNSSDVVSLTNPDGTPFSFKPGNTWFEVVGVRSTIKQTPDGWRFTHFMP